MWHELCHRHFCTRRAKAVSMRDLRRVLFATCIFIGVLAALVIFTGRAEAAGSSRGIGPLPGSPSVPGISVNMTVTVPSAPGVSVHTSVGVTTSGTSATVATSASVTGPGASTEIGVGARTSGSTSATPGVSVAATASAQGTTRSTQVTVDPAPPPASQGSNGAPTAAPSGPPPSPSTQGQALTAGTQPDSPPIAVPQGAQTAPPSTGPVRIVPPVSRGGGERSTSTPSISLPELPSSVEPAPKSSVPAMPARLPALAAPAWSVVAALHHSRTNRLHAAAPGGSTSVGRMAAAQQSGSSRASITVAAKERRVVKISHHVKTATKPQAESRRARLVDALAPPKVISSAAASIAVAASHEPRATHTPLRSLQPVSPFPLPDLSGGALASASSALAGFSSASAVLLLLAGLALMTWRAVRNRSALLPSSVVFSIPVPPG